MKDIMRFFKFLFFSISAGLIQIASFAFLNEVCTLPYWGSYLISLLLSIIWNFTFNRKFTFKSSSNYYQTGLLVLFFYAVFTPVTTVLGNSLSKRINEYIVTSINMALNFILEFLYQRFVVFRKPLDSRNDAKE